jgi:hypothetical protein
LRSPDFRGPAGGRQTIILVLADDTIGYMLDRLQDHGGTAVVAMVSSGTCKLAQLWPASDERLVVAQEDDVVADVHENTEVAMFFDYLAHVGTATVVRRITRAWSPRSRSSPHRRYAGLSGHTHPDALQQQPILPPRVGLQPGLQLTVSGTHRLRPVQPLHH